MKKFLAVLMAAGMTAPAAWAVGNHPMAGCGLAYMLFSKDDNGQPIQILASTTNNLFGSQTFGITSGTSGCTKDGHISLNKQAEVYAEVNFRQLSRDMAAGEGEYANTFASLLGATDAAKPALLKMFQEKYSLLFPSAATTSVDMLGALTAQLEANPKLLG